VGQASGHPGEFENAGVIFGAGMASERIRSFLLLIMLLILILVDGMEEPRAKAVSSGGCADSEGPYAPRCIARIRLGCALRAMVSAICGREVPGHLPGSGRHTAGI
jgi:hypothetical protein